MNSGLRIKHLPLEALVPHARNARTHSDAQISQIAASIEEFGWTNPVLVDGAGKIIAGHGRVLAAVMLGITKIPCIELRHLTEAQCRAYRLADNKIALNAGWDEELLAVELIDLADLDYDLGLTGFDPDELSALVSASVGKEGLTDPDAAPGLPSVATAAHGDLWALGRHRVCCGDSTVPADVQRTLGGLRPHLMVTDPPYRVDYDPTWRQKAGIGSAGAATGKVKNDDRADWREAWALFPGDVVYCWTSGRFVPESILALESVGFERRVLIVWGKTRLVMGRGHYHNQEEECWYAVRKDGTGHWSGGRFETTLWAIDSPRKSETGHSTQKPVECMRRPIVNNSKPGQAVYDPFLGSGTTVIAAEIEGRQCLGLEIEAAYVDVIIKRWQDFVGIEATLEGDGRTFNEVSHERQKAKTDAPKAGHRKSRGPAAPKAGAKGSDRVAEGARSPV